MNGIEEKKVNGYDLINFKVSGMPKEHFDRFKEYADSEWGSSYWHTIKFLLDWYEKTKDLINLRGE